MAWWQKRLKVKYLAELEGSLPFVEAELRKIRNNNKTRRTVAQYAESLVAFCKWCVGREYLRENPLRKLGSFDITPESTRRA